MTHDELLAKIDKVPRIPWAQYIAALRAVVELHKPRASVAPEYPKGFTVGKDCSMCDMNYPCPTIQAIEREL
mgnify:CR=1 FL=1